MNKLLYGLVLALLLFKFKSAVIGSDVCVGALNGDPACADCWTPVTCDGNDSYTEINECTQTQACTIVGTSSACVDHASSSDCSCTVPTQCDAYDPDSIMYCNAQGPIIVQPCGVGETCSNDACVDASLTTTTTAIPGANCEAGFTGWSLTAPDCQTGVLCEDGVALATFPCDPGQYFSPDLGCQPSPPVPCAGCGEGLCPDAIDCAKYYVCDASGNVVAPQTCSDGQFFDSTANPPACALGSTDYATNNKCPPTSVCTGLLGTTVAGGSTTPVGAGTTPSGGVTGGTTSRPTECNEANQGLYPDTSNCKMYWSCQKVSADSWGWVEMSCYGDMVFNPATSACDTPDNVPDCIVPPTVSSQLLKDEEEFNSPNDWDSWSNHHSQ